MWKHFLNFKQIQKFSFSNCKCKTQKISDIDTHENLDTYFCPMDQEKPVFNVRDFYFSLEKLQNKIQRYLSIFSLEIWTLAAEFPPLKKSVDCYLENCAKSVPFSIFVQRLDFYAATRFLCLSLISVPEIDFCAATRFLCSNSTSVPELDFCVGLHFLSLGYEITSKPLHLLALSLFKNLSWRWIQ